MKIVFLDARTVTDCGISLKELEKFGELYEYPIVKDEEIISLIEDADIVFCNKSKLSAQKLEKAKKLKYIGVMATGYDNIDIDYCHKNGITVCNAGKYSTDNVAQQVFAFILNEYSKTAKFDSFVKEGGWINAPSFSPLAYHTNVISEKTLGIFGFGNIGQAVAKIASAFGMKVLACSRTEKNADGVEFTDFDTLLKNSDIITVHCPLNDETRNLFNENIFKKFKTGAFFINTSRGPVVDEKALANALNSGKLSGAAVDVLCEEPMSRDCPLIGAKNITFTPHIAWASDEAKQRLFEIAVFNLQNYLNGSATNEV